ncbi:hypothetical protein FACS1894127_1810 [Clostridia bacterium]|nr:hypothetical protein FACS1894127_1810 [Clostridia bacterium]
MSVKTYLICAVIIALIPIVASYFFPSIDSYPILYAIPGFIVIILSTLIKRDDTKDSVKESKTK